MTLDTNASDVIPYRQLSVAEVSPTLCGICHLYPVKAKGMCGTCYEYRRRRFKLEDEAERYDRPLEVVARLLQRKNDLVDAILEVTAAKPQVKA